MRRRTIVRQRTEEAKAALLKPKEEVAVKYGPKNLCPKCGKVPARYFHVKNCK